MKWIFWNVERLGQGSDEHKMRCIDLVIEEYLRPIPNPFVDDDVMMTGGDVDGIVLCEITSDAWYGGFQIDKTGAVSKRGRKALAQLGYGGVMWSGEHVDLVEEVIPTHNDVFGFPFHLKGGNTFSAHSMRKVMRIRNTNVFVYHANASNKAQWLVHWVAGHLKLAYPNYILIGDLNCSPAQLHNVLNRYDAHYATGNVFQQGAYIASYDLVYDEPTHHVHHGLLSTLDWVVCSPNINCSVTTIDSPAFIEGLEQDIVGSHPDHLPILLEY